MLRPAAALAMPLPSVAATPEAPPISPLPGRRRGRCPVTARPRRWAADRQAPGLTERLPRAGNRGGAASGPGQRRCCRSLRFLIRRHRDRPSRGTARVHKLRNGPAPAGLHPRGTRDEHRVGL